jgi:hypothetical protein
MGAHTIGMADKSQSGFEGYWTPGEESVFNTTYYEAMIDPTLKWKNVVSFFLSCPFLSLGIDMQNILDKVGFERKLR